MYELENYNDSRYRTIYDKMMNAETESDIRSLSNMVLDVYENPRDKGSTVQNNRAASALNVYNEYKDSYTPNQVGNIMYTDFNVGSNGDKETLSTDAMSFDNALFIGDSRFVGVQSQLKELGDDVSVNAVSGSTPAQWKQALTEGTGPVADQVKSLPKDATSISVMLGVNNTQQVEELQEVMELLHERYPNATINYDSTYHVGDNYTYADKEKLNKNVDELNKKMETYCEENDWGNYVDITEGLYDSKGYPTNIDGEGIHLTGDGKDILVSNIANNTGDAATRGTSTTTAKIDNGLTYTDTTVKVDVPKNDSSAGKSSNKVVEKKETVLKNEDVISREVWEGKWGNGEERKRRLEEAGYNYESVQELVDNNVGRPGYENVQNTNNTTEKVTLKDEDVISREVWEGKWGNGEERKRRLEEAGYNYESIQKIVNNGNGSKDSTITEDAIKPKSTGNTGNQDSHMTGSELKDAAEQNRISMTYSEDRMDTYCQELADAYMSGGQEAQDKVEARYRQDYGDEAYDKIMVNYFKSKQFKDTLGQ